MAPTMPLVTQDRRGRPAPARALVARRPGWWLRLPYPLRDTLRRWRGTLGIVVGVGIALGIVMTLSAMGRSLITAYTADFQESGINRYLVTEGGKLVHFLPGDSPGTLDRARSRLAQVRHLPGVQGVVGIMQWTMQRSHEGRRRRGEPTELLTVIGVDGDPARLPETLVLRAGRWLRRADEVVIGWTVSREKALGVGDTLRLNQDDFTIVGIGKLRGVGFGANAVVYLDQTALQQHAGVGDVVNAMLVTTDQPELVDQWAADQEAMAALTMADLVRQAEDAMEGELANFQIFNILALVAGAIFVSSMLSRSVANRRLEFATLKAIGLPRRTILLLVTGEAVLVSLLAGLFGMGFSLAFGTIVLNGLIAPLYGLEFFYAADAFTFVQAFVVAIGLGAVAGLFPAWEAIRVDPVEILREA
jgi:putative ABC transport system permease protein